MSKALPPVDVVIVVLCWRNQVYLPQLLASVAAQEGGLNLELVVCNNASVPLLLSEERAQPEKLHSIASGANLGYGGGNNFAIDWVRQRWNPRYLLVLNSDVCLHAGALQAWLTWADQHPEQAVVGAVQVDPSRKGQVCHGGHDYNRGLSVISAYRPSNTSGPDYVHGAAMLVRASAFANEPVFNDGYFLFFEELELAARVKQKGLQTGYCPGAKVSHFEGGSRSQHYADFQPEVVEYFENLNALRFTRDHCAQYLLTVLLFRVLAKPLYLALRGERRRLVFWALAVGDFFRSRVRRFPFQAGWLPAAGRDQITDAPWPGK